MLDSGIVTSSRLSAVWAVRVFPSLTLPLICRSDKQREGAKGQFDIGSYITKFNTGQTQSQISSAQQAFLYTGLTPSDTLANPLPDDIPPVEGEREQFGHQLELEEHRALEMSVVEMALSTIDGVPNLYVGG